MGLETRSNVSELEARGGLDTELTADDGEDISGGVSTDMVRSSDATLYLDVDGAVDVHVYLSPDSEGSKLFEPEESPVSFEAADGEVVHIDYNASFIKLVASNQTVVWARIEEVV
jgi:hypothetical protein